MRNNPPKTPFATRLSGDAKETELRIRNIFQWKKKRPPIWVLILMASLALFCGGLVSCQSQKDVLCLGLNAKVVAIDTQQMILYVQDIDENADVFGQRCALDCKQAAQEDRLIFVDYETQELTSISIYEFQVGDEIIVEMYTSQKEGAKDASARAEQVQLGTQRELGRIDQSVIESFFDHYQSEFPDYEYSGAQTFSSEDRTLVWEDAPENIVEQIVADSYRLEASFDFDALYELMGGTSLQTSTKNEKKSAKEGLYFTRQVIHSVDVLSQSEFDAGGAYFKTAEMANGFTAELSRTVEEYALTEYTVVYVDLSWEWSEKALELGPQLGDGRYERLFLLGRSAENEGWKIYELFWGEYVLARTLEMRNSPTEIALAQAGFEDYAYASNPRLTTLLYQTIGNRSLMLVEVEGFPHVAGLDNLVMGAFDEGTQAFTGEVYTIRGDEPGYTSWWGTDGCLYVLWTNTIYYQGDGTSNGLGYFRFDGQTLEPIYDLPTSARNCGVLPDIPETEALLRPTAANPDSGDFWFTRKARPVANGFELYEENPDWLPNPTQHTTTNTEVDQWLYMGYVPFAITDHTVTNGVKDLILDYIETTWYGYDRTYYLGEEPGEPQEWDQRIDGVFYAGEEITYETTGVAFRVDRSYYATWSSEDPGPTWRRDETSIYVILGRSMDGETYTDVRGFVTPNGERSLNQMILEITYDLMDLEVSLWRDGYPWPAGPGSEVHFFRDIYDGAAQIEVLEDREPTYWPGSYWTRQSWDGFSALCYHVGEEPGQPDPDAYSVYTIDTTRTDLQTYRGIRVGSTRAEVLEAYPVLYNTEYWHATDPDFPGDDYLWYCVNSDGFGAALLLFFEGDVVSQIRLNNMFN